MKSSLARPLGTRCRHIPHIITGLLGLGWWLGVLPNRTPAARSELKFAPSKITKLAHDPRDRKGSDGVGCG